MLSPLPPLFADLHSAASHRMPTALQPLPPALELKPYKSLSNDELTSRINAVRREFGPKLLILGHHYQQDEVIALSDLRGDSYGLSQNAAESSTCRVIVFCGVHFMAETADILANRPAKLAERNGERVPVILPDLAAGCSMADMAAIGQIEDAWDQLGEILDTEDITPVTYINSAASLKAFVGRHGGIVCTSSNAEAALKWSFSRTSKVMFFPDQHLGRNTAIGMGIGLDQMPVWDPYSDAFGGNTEDALKRSKVILWKGHCSVHQMFQPSHVDYFRKQYPDVKVIVHPECHENVVNKADLVGSTEFIIRTITAAPAGTTWAVGTELNLVNRLKQEQTDKKVFFLSSTVCQCATMYRIDAPHLCWALENLVDGYVVNHIVVPDDEKQWAKVALDRMMALS